MNNLQIIEHNNQRVLTTQQLAEIYETSETNIKTNFNRNKDRFVEGRDYYLLKGNELKQFKSLVTDSNEPQIKFAPILYLWTERGANRHSKILDTNKAWQQFDVLEETYFKVKNETTYQIPNTPMEALKLMFEAQCDSNDRITKLENNMTIETSQQYHLERLAKDKAIRVLGGKNTQAYKLYSRKVFAQLWRDYKDCFKIPSYRDTLKSDYQRAIDYLKSWQPEFNLKMAIEEVNNNE